jgi:hypothetical protein
MTQWDHRTLRSAGSQALNELVTARPDSMLALSASGTVHEEQEDGKNRGGQDEFGKEGRKGKRGRTVLEDGSEVESCTLDVRYRRREENGAGGRRRCFV